MKQRSAGERYAEMVSAGEIQIDPAQRDLAIAEGFLTVDASTVIATHLNQVLGDRPSALLGPDEVKAILEGVKERSAGLVEELLSPDLTDDFEVVHSTFAPGARLGSRQARPTQEVGYVVSGRLEVEIDGQWFSAGPGDSFRIRGEAYDWANPHDVPAVVIWVIAPPVY